MSVFIFSSLLLLSSLCCSYQSYVLSALHIPPLYMCMCMHICIRVCTGTLESVKISGLLRRAVHVENTGISKSVYFILHYLRFFLFVFTIHKHIHVHIYVYSILQFDVSFVALQITSLLIYYCLIYFNECIRIMSECGLFSLSPSLFLTLCVCVCVCAAS